MEVFALLHAFVVVVVARMDFWFRCRLQQWKRRKPNCTGSLLRPPHWFAFSELGLDYDHDDNYDNEDDDDDGGGGNGDFR